jgi:hypothetical protein
MKAVYVLERIYPNGDTQIAGVYTSLTGAIAAMRETVGPEATLERYHEISDEWQEHWQANRGEWTEIEWSIFRLEVDTPAFAIPDVRRCRVCGCDDDDCRQCIAKTGGPCAWVEGEWDLCSACVPVEVTT